MTSFHTAIHLVTNFWQTITMYVIVYRRQKCFGKFMIAQLMRATRPNFRAAISPLFLIIPHLVRQTNKGLLVI